MGFPKQEYWSGLHFLLQGIFPTQGLNPRLLHRKADPLPLSRQGHRGEPEGAPDGPSQPSHPSSATPLPPVHPEPARTPPGMGLPLESWEILLNLEL